VLGTTDGHGVFSESGLVFLSPGLLLLCFGAASLMGVKLGELKKDRILLRPTPAGIIGFIVGAGLILALFGGKTNRKLLEAEAAFLKSRAAQYAAFGARIAEEGAPPPAPLRGPLSPRPIFREKDPSSNVDFISIGDLSDRFADLRPALAAVYISGALAEALNRFLHKSYYDDWRYERELEQAVATARQARYTVVYRTTKAAGDLLEDCRVWLFDLSTSRLLLQSDPGCGVSYGAEGDIFRSLENATGGSFRARSH